MKYLILLFPLIANAQFRPNPVSAPLLNYSVGTNTPLSVSDTILTAFQNLQGQSNAVSSTLTGKANLVGGNTFTGEQFINSSLAASSTISTNNTTSGTFVNTGEFLASNMALGNNAVLRLGKDATANDSSELRFFYDNDNSNFNRLNFGWSAGNVTASMLVNGQTGFGTETPAASAKVQIDSTTQGFLIPRMTSAERLAIGTPANGLQVYDTTLNTVCIYKGTFWSYEITVIANSIFATTGNAYVVALTSPSLEAGRYKITVNSIFQSATTTNGIGIRVSPVTATANQVHMIFSIPANTTNPQTSTSVVQMMQEAPFQDRIVDNSPFANQDFPVIGEGVINLTAGGTIAISIRSQDFGTSTSLRVGSVFKIERVN